MKDKGFEISVKVPFDKRIVKAIGRKEIPSVAEYKLFEELGFKKLAENLKD